MDDEEKHHFRNAFMDSSNYTKQFKVMPNFATGRAKLVTKSKIPKTGLFSFPGSGSDVLREYLEEATKILTGSDSHKSKKFLAEGMTSK